MHTVTGSIRTARAIAVKLRCTSLLLSYAYDHNGVYPCGESTPEASLSLLYPQYADANLLRGKTVPLDVVQEILQSGQRLGPDTCGWHYVEGLTQSDDPSLALFWDKAGLGHNGERLRGGGHVVWFRVLEDRHVEESEWPEFV